MSCCLASCCVRGDSFLVRTNLDFGGRKIPYHRSLSVCFRPHYIRCSGRWFNEGRLVHDHVHGAQLTHHLFSSLTTSCLTRARVFHTTWSVYLDTRTAISIDQATSRPGDICTRRICREYLWVKDDNFTSSNIIPMYFWNYDLRYPQDILSGKEFLKRTIPLQTSQKVITTKRLEVPAQQVVV